MFCFSSAQITYIYSNPWLGFWCSVRLSARSKERLTLCSLKKLKILNIFSGIDFVQKCQTSIHVLSLSFLGLYLFKYRIKKYMFCLSLCSLKRQFELSSFKVPGIFKILKVFSGINWLKSVSFAAMFCPSLSLSLSGIYIQKSEGKPYVVFFSARMKEKTRRFLFSVISFPK